MSLHIAFGYYDSYTFSFQLSTMETNEQNRTRGMETRNSLTLISGEGEGRKVGKAVEGSSRETGINDPWTWTTGWGQIVGAGSGLDGGGQRGKNWDNCNGTTIKKIKNSI